jgi:hypothetical protein
MLEVQQHITQGLTKALDFEKKRQQGPKKLNLLVEEALDQFFFSPLKI